MIIKMHYNYDENTACLQCSLCAHLFCVRPKKQFAYDTAQITANFRIAHGISCFHTASLETIVLFTYTISHKLVNKSALFCSMKVFHFPIFGLTVTQMHPMIITCNIELTPELTASALSTQIGIVHLEF